MRIPISKQVLVAMMASVVFGAVGCQKPAPSQLLEPSPKGPTGTGTKPPTPGPIITVEPKRSSGTSTYLASWSSPTTGELAEANAGNSGFLRSDAFDQQQYDPTVRFLRLETTGGQTIGVTSLTLMLNKNGTVNTIKAWKDPDDYDRIKWSVNGTVLQRCYVAPSACTPLCKSNSHGLPPEFYGTWDLATTVATDPATDPSLFAKAKSRADFEPCP